MGSDCCACLTLSSIHAVRLGVKCVVLGGSGEGIGGVAGGWKAGGLGVPGGPGVLLQVAGTRLG